MAGVPRVRRQHLPQDHVRAALRVMEDAPEGISRHRPQQVALSTFQNHLIDYDATESAAACKIPVAYIATANPTADLERFRSLCPQLVTSQVMLAGHFAPLVAPDQVNAMIERFLAIKAA